MHVSLLFYCIIVINVQEPVENWPLCDCLISFHCKGFPLEKAVMYTELRRPFVINDLYMQYKLQNRYKDWCCILAGFSFSGYIVRVT